MVINSLQDTT